MFNSRGYFDLEKNASCSDTAYDEINWRNCIANDRYFATIGKHLNVTIKVGDQPKPGYVDYVYSDFNNYSAYTVSVIEKPWSIVYCNYDPPPSKQSSLLLWLLPLSPGLWTAQILMLLLVSLVTVLIKSVSEGRSASSFWQVHKNMKLSCCQNLGHFCDKVLVPIYHTIFFWCL